MSDNNRVYDCGYVQSVSDEYFHGDLSETEEKAIDSHLSECAECKAFYDEEKEMTDIIKSSAYSPENSVASLVMKKIIDEKITVEKPRGKRPIPFGMVSAAAIILIMIAVSRTPIMDILGITSKSSDNASAENLIINAEEQAADMEIDGIAEDMDNDKEISSVTDAMLKPYYFAGGEESENKESGMNDTQRSMLADSGGGVQYNDSSEEDIVAEAAVETPAPAPAAVISQFSVDLEPAANIEVNSDIPIPTGPFSNRNANVIICVSVSDDVKQNLAENIIAEIENAETDIGDPNIIYMKKIYYDDVINIFLAKGIGYEIREFRTDADEIAVFFY